MVREYLRLIGGVLLGAAIAIFIGYGPLPFVPVDSLIRDVLRTLITAQVSLLAIIFSVVFIVTQIVSTRYSTGYIELFSKSPAIKHTFYISMVSITLNILFLTTLHIYKPNTKLAVFIVLLEGSLAFFWGIYKYITIIFTQSTPTNILKQYGDNLSSMEYVESSVSAAITGTTSDHPLQVVYDTSRNAINEEEIGVAEVGETVLSDVSNEIVDEIVCTGRTDDIAIPQGYEDDYANTEEGERIGLLFSPVLDRYFPEIAQRAAEVNEPTLVRNTMEDMSELGSKGIECDAPNLANLSALLIHQRVIRPTPDPTNKNNAYSELLHTAVSGVLDIFEESLEEDELDTFLDQSHMVYEGMRVIDGKIDPENIHQNSSIMEFAERQQKWYRTFVEKHQDYFKSEDFSEDDLLGKKSDGITLTWEPELHDDPRVSVLINIRLNLMAITAEHTKSLERSESPGLISTSLDEAWRKIVRVALSNPPRASAVLLVQRYLEISIYRAEEYESHAVTPILHLADAQGDQIEVIEEAFDNIQQNPDSMQFIEYYGFRGLPRSLTWTPYEFAEHSDDYLKTSLELRTMFKKHVIKKQLNRANSAATQLQQQLSI
jgi:hypothetical protein